jgi:hypothetical protein
MTEYERSFTFVVYDLKGDFITNCHRAFAGLSYFLGKENVREVKRGEVWT